MFSSESFIRLGRCTVGGVAFLLMLLIGMGACQAGEILPMVGLSRTVNGGRDATTFGGVAFRGSLMPMLQTEIGVAYRSESRNDGRLKVRQWPVTASLYLKPIPLIYAGGGVGWYQTTFDYDSTVPASDETSQDFGVHLGGGIQAPLGTAGYLDLGGRYVMMRDQESRLVPEKFDADFWMTSIGVGFKF